MEETDDPEQEEYFAGRLRQAGTHIMGRVSYQGMAKTWPTSSHPVAAPMNDIPKVVFSRTLESAGWPETEIARGDTAAEIARLKSEPGGEILAHGGTQFVRSLIQPGLAHLLTLRLVSSTAFPSGILELVYSPAGRQERQAGQLGANS